MKKLFWGIICSLIVTVGCTNEADNPVRIQEKVELKNFSNTGCKGIFVYTENNVPYFELKATANNMLYVKHVNALFNCGSNLFEAKVEADGNSITVTEYDRSDPEYAMACMCKFDLGYDIGPLEEGKNYTIKIITGSAQQDHQHPWHHR